MERHRQAATLLDLGKRGEVRAAGPVRLRRGSHVGGRLGKGVLGLRKADHLHRLHRRHRDLQRPWVGIADVLAAAITIRRAMKVGSSPAATMLAHQ